MKSALPALTLALALAPLTVAAQTQPLPPPPPGAPPIATTLDANGQPLPPPPPPDAQPVAYAQPAVVYVPAQAPRLRRARPTLVPYDGGPVPPGARVVERVRLGLAIGGGVTFGVSWITSMLVGVLVGAGDSITGTRSNALWLAVPVIGPVTFGATRSVEGSGWTLLVLDTVLQGGGLAMMIYGLANRAQYLSYDGVARRDAPRWTLMPGAPGAERGVSFAMTF